MSVNYWPQTSSSSQEHKPANPIPLEWVPICTLCLFSLNEVPRHGLCSESQDVEGNWVNQTRTSFDSYGLSTQLKFWVLVPTRGATLHNSKKEISKVIIECKGQRRHESLKLWIEATRKSEIVDSKQDMTQDSSSKYDDRSFPRVSFPQSLFVQIMVQNSFFHESTITVIISFF